VFSDVCRRDRSLVNAAADPQAPSSQVAGEPEHQQDQQHQTEQPATVMRSAPAGPAPVVPATTTEQEHQQNYDDQHRHIHRILLAAEAACLNRTTASVLFGTY
jgi:hypothetical protein